jgi:hypothetical protein
MIQKELFKSNIIHNVKFANNFACVGVDQADQPKALRGKSPMKIIYDMYIWNSCHLPSSLADYPVYTFSEMQCGGVFTRQHINDFLVFALLNYQIRL